MFRNIHYCLIPFIQSIIFLKKFQFKTGRMSTGTRERNRWRISNSNEIPQKGVEDGKLMKALNEEVLSAFVFVWSSPAVQQHASGRMRL